MLSGPEHERRRRENAEMPDMRWMPWARRLRGEIVEDEPSPPPQSHEAPRDEPARVDGYRPGWPDRWRALEALVRSKWGGLPLRCLTWAAQKARDKRERNAQDRIRWLDHDLTDEDWDRALGVIERLVDEPGDVWAYFTGVLRRLWQRRDRRAPDLPPLPKPPPSPDPAEITIPYFLGEGPPPPWREARPHPEPSGGGATRIGEQVDEDDLRAMFREIMGDRHSLCAASSQRAEVRCAWLRRSPLLDARVNDVR